MFSAAAVLASAATSASAQDWPNLQNMYVSILGGQTFYPNLSYDGGLSSIDRGFNAGGRIGYGLDEWSPVSGFSVEADAFYDQSDLSGNTRARYDSLSYMGNLIYHLDTGFPVGIYGGAGAGAVRTEVADPLSNRNSTVFGWQALGGLEYPFSPEASLFVEYRYQNAHDANLRFIGGPVGNTTNNASVGVKFHL